MTGWHRMARPLLAALALLYLGAMVATGAMPVQRQLVRFEAHGVLKAPPDEVLRVDLRHGAQRLTLVRTAAKAWATPDGADIGAAGSRVSLALTMLHNSGPVREMDGAELAGADAASFGLDPPQLSATLYGAGNAPILTVHFGGHNPEAYLQYMRIDGDARLYLMSRFVGAEWHEAMEAAAH